jgi:hypothetical protein
VPIIQLGNPENNPEDYNVYEMESIKIYIDKKTKSHRGELIIDLASLFKWKKLTLEGADIL